MRTPATKISYIKSNVEISKMLIRDDGALTNKRKFAQKITAKFWAMLELSLKIFLRKFEQHELSLELLRGMKQ